MPESIRTCFLFLSSRQQGVYKFNQPLRLGRSFAPLDAGVNVFGILAEDDDVHLFGMAHGRGHAGDKLHRPPAGVEIHQLPQRHVQAANAATHGRRQRALDGNAIFLDGVERALRQPFAKLAKGLFPRKDFVPNNAPLAAEDLFHRRIKNPLRGFPDVAPGSVTFNVGNHRSIRNYKSAVRIGDGLAFRRDRVPVISCHGQNNPPLMDFLSVRQLRRQTLIPKHFRIVHPATLRQGDW